jgi:circadian clock protein KaiB
VFKLKEDGIRLLLFVAGDGPRSIVAIENLRSALDDFQHKPFVLEIVNVHDDATRALEERVIVTPTLFAPDSRRRLVGDLSQESHLYYFLQGLSAMPASADESPA